MRARGISYDTGFVRNGATSLKDFDPEVVKRELRIIRDDLHCNACASWAVIRSGWSSLRHTPPISDWRSGSRRIRWS
jgi:hypothetical protein